MARERTDPYCALNKLSLEFLASLVHVFEVMPRTFMCAALSFKTCWRVTDHFGTPHFLECDVGLLEGKWPVQPHPRAPTQPNPT